VAALSFVVRASLRSLANQPREHLSANGPSARSLFIHHGFPIINYLSQIEQELRHAVAAEAA